MAFSTFRAAVRSIVVNGIQRLPDGVVLSVMQGVGMKRRMDYAGSDLYLNVRSPEEYFIRLRSCEKEPETVQWLEEETRPGDVVYDIGANIGAYALVAARGGQGVQKVYAFEPGFANYTQLCHNVLLNGCDGVVVPLPIALSNHNGLSEFRMSNLSTGAAAQGLSTNGAGVPRLTENEAVHTVLAWRLDDLVASFGLLPPNLVKLDVDGVEAHVLEGAYDTLRRPELRSVLVETGAGSPECEAVFALLSDAGFELTAEHSHKKVSNYVFGRVPSAVA